MLYIVLALALMFVPFQEAETRTVGLRDMGSFTYDPSVSIAPDVDRLYGLVETILEFIEARCVPLPDPLGIQGNGCYIEPSQLELRVHVLAYADFEEMILEKLDRNKPALSDEIRGDKSLINGHTQHSITGPRLFFYQMPSDVIFVHEMMHVIYPFSDEKIAQQRQSYFLTSHEYKEWLRRNY